MPIIDAYGRDARLLFRRQGDAATDETVGPFVEIPFERCTLGAASVQERVAENPTSRWPSALEPGLRSGSGEIEAMADINWSGWLLSQFFGLPTTTDDGGGDYTHVFEPDITDIPPYGTFAVEHTALATPLRFRHGGVIFNEMNLSGAKSGRPLMMRFGCFTLRETPYESTLAGSMVERGPREPLHDWRLTTAVSGVTDAGAGAVSFSARLNNGLALDQDTQTGTQDAFKADPASDFMGDGTLRVRLQKRAQYDAARAGSLLTVTQTWSLGANKSLVAVYRNVRLQEESGRVEGAGLVEVDFPWQFDEPPAGQAPVTFTLKNQTASYANPT